MQTNILVDKVVEFLESKKAIDINIIDIKNISIVSDYFVICSGNSLTHIKTLADTVMDKLDEIGYKDYKKEGYKSAKWILIDLKDVVVHIFHKEERSFYNLERLWSDGILSKSK